MHWVLLHLIEDAALEDVAEEALVGVLEALKVALERFSFHLEHLNLAKRQGCVEPITDLIQVKDLPVDILDIEILDQANVLIFLDSKRVG